MPPTTACCRAASAHCSCWAGCCQVGGYTCWCCRPIQSVHPHVCLCLSGGPMGAYGSSGGCSSRAHIEHQPPLPLFALPRSLPLLPLLLPATCPLSVTKPCRPASRQIWRPHPAAAVIWLLSPVLRHDCNSHVHSHAVFVKVRGDTALAHRPGGCR